MENQEATGNNNLGIGSHPVEGLVTTLMEARGKNQGRVYLIKENDKIIILAKSIHNNQNRVIDILKELGY